MTVLCLFKKLVEAEARVSLYEKQLQNIFQKLECEDYTRSKESKRKLSKFYWAFYTKGKFKLELNHTWTIFPYTQASLTPPTSLTNTPSHRPVKPGSTRIQHTPQIAHIWRCFYVLALVKWVVFAALSKTWQCIRQKARQSRYRP